MTAAAERQKRLHAERQKRLRALHRKGEIVSPVPVTNDIIAVLIHLGWLVERESEDRKQIGLAIRGMLDDLAVSHRQQIP